MAKHQVYFWKQIPLLRLLLPFIAGIIFQWYIGFTPVQLLVISLSCLVVYFPFYFFSNRIKFSFGWLQGVAIMLLFFVSGAFITYHKDIRHQPNWVGNVYKDSSAVLATIEEPLVEKSKSYKALASIQAVNINKEWMPVKGKILLYFKNDSSLPKMQYGSQVIFYKPLQAITNSGNPGTFNYQRYSAFHDIYHQCFLKSTEFILLDTYGGNAFNQWLFNIQFSVIAALKKYITGEKEQGVAEALLIGYRDDLDKNLVQAYSNTGVVHIIAISGLHLGMIYGTLIWVFSFFKKRKWLKWVKFVVILGVLWIFSLVAGAAPSILRSAVMFTCILFGEILNKKSSIYNTLAASAFIILCFNPFSLWDVGFQLSYAAVLSIVIFMQPINRLLYFKNKIINGIWKLNSVTLSAQLLTIPIVTYHFHQFPNFFLLTNFVVVPLSSFILYGELGLVILAKIFTPIAYILGKITSALLWCMNSFIEKINELPNSTWNGLQVSIVQAILLFGALIGTSYWLLRKSKTGFYIGLTSALVFVATRSVDFYTKAHQSKLIVYNVPQHAAIDFISGRAYQFVGDSIMLEDDFLRNFHLKPGRILNRISPGNVEEVAKAYPFYIFNDKKILLIDRPFRFSAADKVKVDMIIISKNPTINIGQLANAFDCKLYVFDGSNAVWKTTQWKKDCDHLHLRHHSTADLGALEIAL